MNFPMNERILLKRLLQEAVRTGSSAVNEIREVLGACSRCKGRRESYEVGASTFYMTDRTKCAACGGSGLKETEDTDKVICTCLAPTFRVCGAQATNGDRTLFCGDNAHLKHCFSCVSL